MSSIAALKKSNEGTEARPVGKERFKQAVVKTAQTDVKEKLINQICEELKSREESQRKVLNINESPEYFEKLFEEYNLENQSKQNMYQDL